jgi:hypothetical protein
MRFTRRHYGAQKGGATNLGSLSEPHREQNLSANPKRTAKSSVLSDDETFHRVQKKANYFLGEFFAIFNAKLKVKVKVERPDLRPAFHSDEVYTPSLRRSEGRHG